MQKKVLYSLASLFTVSALIISCSGKTELALPGFQDINTASNVNSSAVGTDVANPEVSKSNTVLETFVANSYRGVFNEYDKNRSGSIEPQELAEAPNSFKALDKDKNNRLSFAEVSPPVERIRQSAGWIASFYKELQREVDANGDGLISKEEFTSSEHLSAFKDTNAWFQITSTIDKSVNFNGFSSLQFTNTLNLLFNDLQKKFNTFQNTPRVSSNGRIPVVLVQGYAEPSWYFMYGIYRDLKRNGWQSIYPVNLFPNITDIKEQARIVAKKIEQAKREQNMPKVDYIAHSLGGLIGRYYIQEMKGAQNIEHYVSISTPHYGTYVSWLGLGEAARQMRPGSDFLKKLNTGNPIYGSIKYTSIWTKTDEIVIPSENAVLNGSRIMPAVSLTGHLLILWSSETYKQIKDSLTDQFSS